MLSKSTYWLNIKYIWQFLRVYPRDLIVIFLSTIFSIITILIIGQLLKYFIDYNNDSTMIVSPLSSFMMVAVIIAVSAFFRISRTVMLSEKIFNDIQLDRFKALLKCTYHLFESQSAGDLHTRITTDIHEIRIFLANPAVVGLRNTIQLFGSTIFLLIVSPVLSSCILIVFPVLILPLKLISRRSRNASTLAQNFEGKINGLIEEVLHGILIIKSFCAEKNIIDSFKQKLYYKLNLNKHKAYLRALNVAIIIFTALSVIIGVLYIGFIKVSNQSMSNGDLTSFIFYALLLFNSLSNFTDIFTQANMLAGAITRIKAIDDFDKEIINNTKSRHTLVPSNISIRFDNVAFRYPNVTSSYVLDVISFEINAGEKVAFVGKSGAGKSTILKLLMGIYRPQSGNILINNIDSLCMDLKEQRSYFSYVPQDIILFEGTLKDNITLLDKSIPNNAVNAAAEKSLVNDFALDLEQPYSDYIGPKGLKLSGGQRQRISLARAIVYDAPVILLDEATNSLDNLSESIIQQTLLSFKNNKTIILIAHRLSTIQYVDRIFMVHNKKIIASGTHQNLITSCSEYKDLYTAQFNLHDPLQ